MNRRAYLSRVAAATASATAPVAGCVGDDAPRVGLGEFEVTNRRERPVTLRIAIDRAGERRYDEVHSLAAMEGNVVDGVEIVEDWMGDRVEYVARAATPDGRLRASFSTADAERYVDSWGDSDCFTVLFTIESSRIAEWLGAQETCPDGE